ncbi:MAG: hypothetical protein KJZ65_03135 [Phycisphaerales bacterium]|nr:hypothetical protein [Phycisphaerales bacterium]
MPVGGVPTAAPEPIRSRGADRVAREEEHSASAGSEPLAQRLAAVCGPRLRTLLARVRIEQVGSDEFELHVEASQRAMVEAHLWELRPVFEKVVGVRDLSLRLADGVEVEPGDRPEVEVPMLRASADAELEHPLVKEVASLFGATPKRIEPRGK